MIASRSASSTTTNSPFETSQPLTSSSRSTSRSWVGHHRFCLIGVRHSRCSIRNETSDCRAAGAVAGASPIGMLTRPKLIEPFQVVLMSSESVGDGPRSAYGVGLLLKDPPRADVGRGVPTGVEARHLDDGA